MDYFLFNFLGVQFHYTMSLKILGNKCLEQKKLQYCLSAKLTCVEKCYA